MCRSIPPVDGWYNYFWLSKVSTHNLIFYHSPYLKVIILIIEGDDFSWDTYEKVKEDYMGNELSVKEICEKHDISEYSFNRYRKEITKQTGFRRDLSHRVWSNQHKTPKFYSKIRGKYRIQKMVKGKCLHYHYFDTEEEAKNAVEWLKKHNWNRELFKEVYV